MSREQFDELLSLVGPEIRKTGPRALDPELRLFLTLRFLATGDSLPTLAFAFRVGKTTAATIVNETCEVIWKMLQPIVLKLPTIDHWKHVANGFADLGFPNCIGAIDGKHVRMQCPAHAETMYFNYKKYHSIVLMAVCDSKRRFTYVDIGAYGSQSDGGVFINCTLNKMIQGSELNIPVAEELPVSNINFPFLFIGDEAFRLQEHILRPYSGRTLSADKTYFNYRLSSARITIESAFGILCQKWRIFHRSIIANPENVDNFIKASVVLHNYLQTEEECGNFEKENMALHTMVDLPMDPGANNAAALAVINRNKYKDYLYNQHQH